VDHAVRLKHVLDGDLGGVAFGVPHPDGAIFHPEAEVFAFDGFKHGLAPALIDHRREVARGDAARNNVIGQDLSKLGLVLGLEQRLDGARRQLGERVVSRREHGEGTLARQRVDEVSGLDCGDERRVVL